MRSRLDYRLLLCALTMALLPLSACNNNGGKVESSAPADISEPPQALWKKILEKNPDATIEEWYEEPNGAVEITYYTGEGRAISTFDQTGNEIASELSLNPEVMPQPIKTLINSSHPDAEITVFTKKNTQSKVTYEIEVNDGTHYVAYIFDQSFKIISKNVQPITEEEQEDLLDYGTRQ